jgi:hypothetical protein
MSDELGFEAQPGVQQAQQPSVASEVRAWAANVQPSPEERLADLPAADGFGTVQHPFQMIDRDAYLSAIKGAGIARRTHGAPIALVNLHDLVAIQGSINPERVGHHLADPKLYAPGARAPGHGMLVDRPVIVRKNGMLMIHDGHHRLTAMHLRGQTTAKVRFVDLDVGA